MTGWQGSGGGGAGPQDQDHPHLQERGPSGEGRFPIRTDNKFKHYDKMFLKKPWP